MENHGHVWNYHDLVQALDHRFSWKGDLTTHIQSVHEGVKYDCDYKAAQQGSHTAHIQLVHEE